MLIFTIFTKLTLKLDFQLCQIFMSFTRLKLKLAPAFKNLFGRYIIYKYDGITGTP